MKNHNNFLHWKVLVGLVSISLFFACAVSKENSGNSSKKPDWVNQRPTNTQYYVGIGYANKLNNAGDFQRVAKKNALDDLIGEIKVTVSSNSILSQFQNNQNFSQQYFSDTRMNASETMEGFQVMDSWENKTDYWIYYRISKAEFEANKRRKIREASEKALDLMTRADMLSLNQDFVQAYKLRIKAAVCLQNYLNESIETSYKGKQVYLMNELFGQLQNQLYQVSFRGAESVINATIGKSLSKPIATKVFLKPDSNEQTISYLPLKIEGNSVRFKGNPSTETQQDGNAQFAISNLQSPEAFVLLQVKVDLDKLTRVDSLNAGLKKILLNMEGPTTSVRVHLSPIKIFMTSKEENLGTRLDFTIIEPVLKKKLMEEGCTFVKSIYDADYTLDIEARTKDQGVMWGTMLKSSIDFSLILRDANTQNELLRDGLANVLGYQNTKEKAGIEAFKTMSGEVMNKVYPHLANKLFSKD